MTTTPSSDRFAVIGAGQMGTGIAQTVAAHGMKVMLTDVDLARAEAGKANIEKALAKLMGRGKIEAHEAESLLARITPVADYAPFAEADLIIEAATEREEIKNAIFDAAGKVVNVERSGVDKLAYLDPDGNKTPTLGRERGFLEDLFGNIGQVGGAGVGGAPGGGPNGQ